MGAARWQINRLIKKNKNGNTNWVNENMAKEKDTKMETKTKKSSKGDEKLYWVDAKGKRVDGRGVTDLRPIKYRPASFPMRMVPATSSGARIKCWSP